MEAKKGKTIEIKATEGNSRFLSKVLGTKKKEEESHLQ
jgi:hypothetical protein